MHCGQPIAQVPASAAAAQNRSIAMPPATIHTSPMQQDFDEKSKRNIIIAWAIGGVAAIAAILIGAHAFVLLGAGVKADDTKVLAARGSGSPPVLEKAAAAPAQMPADVEDWLKHLEKCEAQKVQISGDQYAEALKFEQEAQALGAGMGMMDPYDQASSDDGQAPGSYAKGKVLDFRPQWEQLITFFNSYPPPPECKPIADDFNRALQEIPGMMGDIAEVLNTADTDPTGALQKIKKVQNSSYGDIDRYFLRCDQKVGAICDKYNKKKWFNVKGDVTAGGALGRLGL